jgi:hypothetical protein
MSGVRMLIWTPLNAAELQKAMYGGKAGPSALVPVQSGTVLLPSLDVKLGDMAYLANRVRQIAGSAALAVWNDDAALLYFFTTAVGRASMWGPREAVLRLSAEAKRSGPLGKLFDRATAGQITLREKEKWQLDAIGKLVEMYPAANRDAALGRLREFENGRQAIPEFLRAAGLADVAQVAELAELGRADALLQTLAPPRMPRWPLALILPVMLLSALMTVLLNVPTVVHYGIGALLAAVVLVIMAVVRRRIVGKQPINTVLPVIPVTQGAAPTD